MNHRRRKPRKQPRCTLCSTHRWKGNAAGRFKPKDEAAEPEDSNLAPAPKKPKKPKMIRLMGRYTGAPRAVFRDDGEWACWGRYRTKTAANQALRAHQRHWRAYNYEWKLVG